MMSNVRTYTGKLINLVYLNVPPGYDKHKKLSYVPTFRHFLHFAPVSHLKTYDQFEFIMNIQKYLFHVESLYGCPKYPI